MAERTSNGTHYSNVIWRRGASVGRKCFLSGHGNGGGVEADIRFGGGSSTATDPGTRGVVYPDTHTSNTAQTHAPTLRTAIDGAHIAGARHATPRPPTTVKKGSIPLVDFGNIF